MKRRCSHHAQGYSPHSAEHLSEESRRKSHSQPPHRARKVHVRGKTNGKSDSRQGSQPEGDAAKIRTPKGFGGSVPKDGVENGEHQGDGWQKDGHGFTSIRPRTTG